MISEGSTIQWRKSSRSGPGSNECVEVGTSPRFEEVLVRDSKDRGGPTLSFDRRAWTSFVTFVAGREPPRA